MCFIVLSVSISFHDMRTIKSLASLDQSDIWNMAALCFFYFTHSMAFEYLCTMHYPCISPAYYTRFRSRVPLTGQVILVIFTFHSKLECIDLLNVWTTSPTQKLEVGTQRLFMSSSECLIHTKAMQVGKAAILSHLCSLFIFVHLVYWYKVKTKTKRHKSHASLIIFITEVSGPHHLILLSTTA